MPTHESKPQFYAENVLQSTALTKEKNELSREWRLSEKSGSWAEPDPKQGITDTRRKRNNGRRKIRLQLKIKRSQKASVHVMGDQVPERTKFYNRLWRGVWYRGQCFQGYYSVTELSGAFNDDRSHSAERLAVEGTWDGKWTAKCMTWCSLNLL